MSKLIISPSPHQLGNNSVKKMMYGVIIALIPALGISFYFYGIGALIVTLTAVVFSVIFEWLITKFMLKQTPRIIDGSAVITGLLLAFNVPSNLPIWIIIIGALVAIGIGKMTFGGLGNNPFNPALVGRVFLLISFPVQMTSWPKPGTQLINWYASKSEMLIDGEMVKMVGENRLDAITGATPLGIMKEGLGNGEAMSKITEQIPSNLEMFYGNMGGSLGEIAAIALILGGIFLIYRKIITWHIPVSTIVTAMIFAGIFWLINPEQNADPLFHLLTGGLLLGAIFMATDYVTSPMTPKGMLVFGAGIGFLTIIIRVFGAYPEGVSFAILIMNTIVPIINKYMKPKLFGAVKKVKEDK